jgi:mannose-6-phosphate isomerase-like protein (cupin superfamily)
MLKDQRMTTPSPAKLSAALASFDQVDSPRIAAWINDYHVRVAHTRGEHVWHVYDDTDEFFLVRGGQFDVSLRDPDGHQSTVSLRQGDIFVVPRGAEHKPSSENGAILMFEPSGTLSTGTVTTGTSPATSTAPPVAHYKDRS